jgi:hypothetical protein
MEKSRRAAGKAIGTLPWIRAEDPDFWTAEYFEMEVSEIASE